ncbi:hypothetical protein QH73_0022415 [Scytonema millei VB511283]|uniref:Uncharacterized protein n=2 Tax=Scytonema TaxID=1203 RepID=A0A9X5E9F6_9CYAN|nr:hypothetical protein [Scytonema millei VB511283]
MTITLVRSLSQLQIAKHNTCSRLPIIQESHPMSKQLIYLTLPAIAEVIEDVLATEPYRFYQNFFVIPELQQKLIADIFRQIRDRYTVLIDDTQPSSNYSTTALSSQQWLDMKEIAQQRIYHLLQENRCEWEKLMSDRANVVTELTEKNNIDC